MLDIAKYDENDWDWWEDTVEWWSTSTVAHYCFRANIAEFTNEKPPTNF